MTIQDVMMVLPGHNVATGDIVIEGGTIAEVKVKGAIERSEIAERSVGLHEQRTPHHLVLPGLINCHGHTSMTLVRGLGGGLPLDRWLNEAIFPVEAKMTPADVKAGMVLGIMEMLAGGTTTIADMYDFPEVCIEALKEAGMRGRVCRVGLSFVPGRLDDAVNFTRSANVGVDDRCRADICLHSEYLTDEAYCRGLAAANRELKRPLNVHVSETEKEHAECIARHGKTPIAYLADLGLFDFGGYAAHCVWCTDDDFRIMAERGVSLVHNPSSNLKLGSGIARIARAMELGVNVALGTDGCASNDDLDMFEEMRLAALLAKGVSRDPTALSAWDVIDMATVNGARALGMDDVGEIAVGKRADLCIVDLDKPHLQPCLDVANLVVYAMKSSDVVQTIVDGKVLYERGGERGRFTTIDVAKAKAEFLAAVKRIGL